jgi:hypothetical protein
MTDGRPDSFRNEFGNEHFRSFRNVFANERSCPSRDGNRGGRP